MTIVGFPNALLSRPMFDVMLQQAGLRECVLAVESRPGAHGRMTGQATVTFSSQSAAEACAHHFGGRPWGAGSSALGVEIAPSARVCSASATTGASEACLSTPTPTFVPCSKQAAHISIRDTMAPAHVSAALFQGSFELASKAATFENAIQALPSSVFATSPRSDTSTVDVSDHRDVEDGDGVSANGDEVVGSECCGADRLAVSYVDVDSEGVGVVITGNSVVSL